MTPTPKQQPPTLPTRPASAVAQPSNNHVNGSLPTAPLRGARAVPQAPRGRTPSLGVQVLKVLHLFSGPANKKHGLKAMIECRAQASGLRGRVEVEVEEVDILDGAGKKTRSEQCDILRDDVYKRIRVAATGGAYFAVIAGIPCNTYCVQQLAQADGAHDGLARALRDRDHLAGLLTHELNKADRSRLAAGNALTIRALTICACCYSSGGEVLLENPVDYGASDGLGGLKRGWLPHHALHAPLWLMPWVRAFIEGTASETVDCDQCTLGSDFKKPTTLCFTPLLRRKMHDYFAGAKRRCEDGCRHYKRRHPEVARGLDLETGAFISAKAAAYPADMNRHRPLVVPAYTVPRDIPAYPPHYEHTGASLTRS